MMLSRSHSNSGEFKRIMDHKVSGIFERYFWIWIISISILKLWLVSSLDLRAIGNAAFDDALFVRLASYIVSGEWLGPFDKLTLAKGSFYPLWVALCYPFGLPLLMMQHLVNLLSGAFFVHVLRKANIHGAFLLLLFSLLAFNPSTSSTPALRVSREFLYSSETLIVFAALFGLLLALKNQRKIIIWCGILGISLIPFFLTREEGGWIAPACVLPSLCLVLFPTAKISLQKKIKQTALLFIPVVVLFCGMSLVKLKNYFEYGVCVNTEFQADYFKAAYGSLTRVRHDYWRRYVAVPKEVREKIYKISPSFSELRPYLEGELLNIWAVSEGTQLNIFADYSSHFIWAFRDAVSLAGHYRSASEAKDFYLRLASDVNQACDQGKLKCYPARKTMLPVFHKEYIGMTTMAFFHMLKNVATFQRTFSSRIPKNSGSSSQLRLFEEITHHKNLIAKTTKCASDIMEDESGFLIRQREWKRNVLHFIGTGYQFVIPVFFGLSLFSFVFIFAESTRRGFTPIAAFSAAILLALASRLLLLSYLNVTSFPSMGIHYNMPSYTLILIFSSLPIYGIFYPMGLLKDPENARSDQ